jgi:hypothetical protein
MLYLQFRILAFTALMRLSTAATFKCHNGGSGGTPIECEVTLNHGNTFSIDEDQSWGCTHDMHYCAEIWSASDDEWTWLVHNRGDVPCTGSCSPHSVPSISDYYYECQVESC